MCNQKPKLMKRILKNLSLFTAILLIITSCGTSIKTETMKLPCNSDIRKARKDGMIAVYQVGESSKESIAIKKGELRVTARLQKNLKQAIEYVADEFINEADTEYGFENGSVFKEQVMSYSSEVISNTEILCEEMIKETNGSSVTYKFYIAKGISAEQVINGIYDGMNKAAHERKMELEFDREQFKDRYNEKIQDYMNQ